MMEFKDGSVVGKEEFVTWLKGFSSPSSNGDRIDPNSTEIVYDVCGKEIGIVRSPIASFEANDVGIIFIGTVTKDDGRVVVCYAAVRLSLFKNTVIIDAFGVHDNERSAGVGSLFYRFVVDNVKTKLQERDRNGMVLPWNGIKYTIALQSTFDYQSYLFAIVLTATHHHRHHHHHRRRHRHQILSVDIDDARVSKILSGSCGFWRRMGFTCSKMSFSPIGDSPLSNPVLIMWTNLN